jgi:hypothetical protein
MAQLAEKLSQLRPEAGLYPGSIVSIDGGRLLHSVGTGADLMLPSAVATGDPVFAPNLNPVFFYSWDVHAGQPTDWFRVSVRFTPSEFGITATHAYEVEWVVAPFFLELGAELLLEATPGVGPVTVTLDDFSVRTLRIGAGPIGPDETLKVDLIRNSTNGSWIWLRTDITFPPPVNAP